MNKIWYNLLQLACCIVLGLENNVWLGLYYVLGVSHGVEIHTKTTKAESNHQHTKYINDAPERITKKLSRCVHATSLLRSIL